MHGHMQQVHITDSFAKRVHKTKNLIANKSGYSHRRK
jgi:hypothetical protein